MPWALHHRYSICEIKAIGGLNVKKTYSKPEVELIRLEMLDIIAMSDLDGDLDEDELPLVPA